MSRSFERVFAFFIVIALCFTGIILLERHTRLSRDWPSTAGEIISSEVKMSTSRAPAFRYGPNIVYQFNINGHTYTSNVIAFHFRDFWKALFDSRKYSETLVKRYPKGKIVQVYYRPQSPKISCLETW
jgi:hypothetical protein